MVAESGRGRGREIPAPTLEELWKRIVVEVRRWKNRHRPRDDGGKKRTNLEVLGFDGRETDASQEV